jgi:hypothetical protein
MAPPNLPQIAGFVTLFRRPTADVGALRERGPLRPPTSRVWTISASGTLCGNGPYQPGSVPGGVVHGQFEGALLHGHGQASSILRLHNQAALCVLSDDFGGEWVQISGTATVVDLPEAVEGLVTYFRSISGEHSDWDEYRQAMLDQGKVLIRIAVERWGPISRGGFPSRLGDS